MQTTKTATPWVKTCHSGFPILPAKSIAKNAAEKKFKWNNCINQQKQKGKQVGGKRQNEYKWKLRPASNERQQTKNHL